MAKIYLHIGIGKTGTSSIQRFLHDNRDQLAREHRVFYSEAGMVNHAHHDLGNFHHETMRDEARGFWQDAIRAMMAQTFECAVFSSEQFCYLKPAYVREIRDLLCEHKVKIVFYVRQQVGLVPSAYLQKIKQGHDYHGDVADFFRYAKFGFIYSNRLKYWEEVFGAENIMVRAYDDPVIKANVCADFLKMINVDWHDTARLNIKVNDSLSPSAAKLLRAYDRHVGFAPMREPIARLFAKYSKRAALAESPVPMPSALIEEIRAFYRDDNLAIADRYLDTRGRSYLCA